MCALLAKNNLQTAKSFKHFSNTVVCLDICILLKKNFLCCNIVVIVHIFLERVFKNVGVCKTS